ncbi:MAG: MFS transporter [Gemmatimonadaceae bacterium]|nr:MFS transporter [Acetobacteraceae bacterium]
MPLLGLMYLIAYIDRQNVSFAKLTMLDDLGMSETAYGLGASLFFIGYFLFEVPSNLILGRVGARRWFARIMFTWGLVTVALAYTTGPTMFYILRFLLGACEAGFFPGVLYLLTIWVPFGHRARMVGWFMIASVVANAIGAPIGGSLLDLDGLLGLRGWQWVFVTTGVPAVVMGVVTLFVLPDGPEQARFLNAEQKRWLQETIAAEDQKGGKAEHGNPLAALTDGRVLLLALTFVGFPLAAYGLSYWLPTVVQSFGVSNTTNGFINVLPWVCAGIALWWLPRHSERTGEKTWHIVIPVAIGAVCLVLSVVAPGNTLKFALLCAAAACIFSPQPIFWTLPSSFLSGASAAAGIAVINAVGNLGGFVAQNVVPWIKDSTGSTLAPMFFLAACLGFAGLMIFVVQGLLGRRAAPVPAE